MASLVHISLKPAVWKRNGRWMIATRAQEVVHIPGIVLEDLYP